MRKIEKRFLAVLIAVLLVITGISLPVWRQNTTVSATGALTVEIGTVEIELEQLATDHYLVTIPITIANNPGLTTVQCGASWYPEQMTVLGTRNTASGILPIFNYSAEKDFVWMQAMAQNYQGTEFCSITFQVNEAVQVGDYLPLQAELYDVNGNQANFTDSTMVSTPITAVSGGVRIVDHVIPAVDVAIGNVVIEQATLVENDYVVEVPVTASSNNGFYGMRFGVSWDATQMTAESPSGSLPTGLSMIPSISSSSGTGWIQLYADSTYTGTELCTLRFRIPSDAAKPGATFSITAETLSSSGVSATVINSNGEEGQLTLKSGSIRVRSTQTVNSYGSVSMPTIEVTPEELAANNYQVKYPIYISKNSSFQTLAFGASWNAQDLLAAGCVCDDTKNLNAQPSYSADQNAVWLPFSYQGAGSAYSGTALCTMTFTVRQDAEVGDVFAITAEESGYNGHTATIVNAKGTEGLLNLSSGSIHVITAEEKNASISAKVGDVEVSMDDLEYNDYMVSVPLTTLKNNGFSSLSFGVSWDTDLIEPIDAASCDVEYLGLQSNFYVEQDMVWLTFISIDPYQGYLYDEEPLGTLQLLVSEDVQPGDVIPIYVESVSKSGTAASALDENETPTIPLLLAGSIRITGTPVTTTEPVVTTETTETETLTSVETTTGQAFSETTETTAVSMGSAQTTEVTTESTSTEATETTSLITTTTAMQTTTQETTRNKTVGLSQASLTILVGKTQTLTFTPGVGSSNAMVWISRDINVVKVTPSADQKSAEIQGVSSGVTTVLLLCGDQVYSCEVTVKEGVSGSGSGDIDADGISDLSDLVLMQKLIMGCLDGLSDEAIASADMNGDGCVDCIDALRLLQIVAKT